MGANDQLDDLCGTKGERAGYELLLIADRWLDMKSLSYRSQSVCALLPTKMDHMTSRV
jgi:hypothetical protein